MRISVRRSWLALALFLCAMNASAHETWLAPSAFATAPGQTVAFHLTSGMSFPKLEYAIKPERVERATVRLGRSETGLGEGTKEAESLTFKRAFSTEGLVTAAVVLHPHPIELSDAKVEEYFGEIEATPEVRRLWAQRKGHEAWKETYTKCAKTFVAVGPGRFDESWRTPVNLPLELVPLQSPLELTAGGQASFQILEDGKLLPDLAVGLMSEASSQRLFAHADAEGRVTFTIPKGDKLLLFAVHLRPTGHGWISTFTTLTLELSRQ